MARALPFLLLPLTCIAACAPATGPGVREPAPDAARPSAPDAARPAVAAAPSPEPPERFDWGFSARGLKPVGAQGEATRTLQTLDRDHTVQVFSSVYGFGANERDAIETFRVERGERCSEPERIDVRGRRAFYSRCHTDAGTEHGMALTTGRALLLSTCKPARPLRDECAKMLQTFWLPDPAPERHAIALTRPSHVGARFTMHARLQRSIELARTGPDHETDRQTRRYEGELELLGEVLAVDAFAVPRRVRFTVQQADARVDGERIDVPTGTAVMLHRPSRPQTRVESKGVPKPVAELLESLLGASAYFPLDHRRYGSTEPQPIDGTWAGPSAVQAAGGDAYSKLIAQVDCESGRCLEIETETFIPGLVSLPFAEGTGSEAARILVRGHYPIDVARPVPWYALQLVQHSEGILTENRRAFMIEAHTRVLIEVRLVWHEDP